MKSIPLLVKDDFELQRTRRRRLLRQNVERHAMPTQIDFVGDSSINHALIAVAQEHGGFSGAEDFSKCYHDLLHVNNYIEEQKLNEVNSLSGGGFYE